MSAQTKQKSNVLEWWRTRLWSRRLPLHTTIEARTGWPLLLLPALLFGQLVTPHPVWIVLLVTIVGLYAIGYALSLIHI